MNVYWGYASSGKTLLQFNHLYGNKSVAYIDFWYKYNGNLTEWKNIPRYVIKKKVGNCHLTGFKDNNLFWDITITNELHHKRIEEEDVRICTDKTRCLEYNFGCVCTNNNFEYVQTKPHYYIVPDLTKTLSTAPPTVRLGKKEIIKYSNLKYQNSSVYYKAINRQQRKNTSGKLKVMALEDYPKLDTIIMHINGEYGKCDEQKSESINEWYKDKRNIVPYHSNLLHSAVKRLDEFCDFRRDTKWNEDVIQAYNDDKKMIYDYLDEELILRPQTVIKKLMKDGIDFEYFDLDKGSYKDTFGLSRDLSRNLDNPLTFQLKNAKDKKKARSRYFQLYDIADKYVKSKGINDIRM